MGKNRNVDALSSYPVELESDSNNGVIADEVQTVSVEEMYVSKFSVKIPHFLSKLHRA